MFTSVVKRTVAAAAAASCLTATALAYDTVAKTVNYRQEPIYTPEHGATLPPIGFVRYCAANPGECKPLEGDISSNLVLTETRWQQLNEVNTYVNAKIAPLSDLELYDKPEHWIIPEYAGDCEDYVLLKKRYLEGLGFPAENMLITVVLNELDEGHAVLTVKTDAGDFILDNRRHDIRRWSESNYQFLKRQSQTDPNKWVALTPKQSRARNIISGDN
jgi:predicted transglutaminase-like cysteine proteinase